MTNSHVKDSKTSRVAPMNHADDVEKIPIDRGHFSANVTADDMFEYYLPPFHDCIATARAMHVMTSLNAINGARQHVLQPAPTSAGK